MSRKQKPQSLGTVWTACKIQVIDEETMKFKTVAECADTPNAIKQTMKQHGLKWGWVYNSVMGRRHVDIRDGQGLSF